MSVPRPSFSLTAELTNNIDAVPAFFALKVIERTEPLLPVKPGLGAPPLKVACPMPFEKPGSSTHREKIDDLVSSEITSRKSFGN